jgi:hypothetical protein
LNPRPPPKLSQLLMVSFSVWLNHLAMNNPTSPLWSLTNHLSRKCSPHYWQIFCTLQTDMQSKDKQMNCFEEHTIIADAQSVISAFRQPSSLLKRLTLV